MKKILSVLLILILLLPLGACGRAEEAPLPTPTPAPTEQPAPTPSPSPTAAPELPEAPAVPAWATAYTDFLTAHFDALVSASGGAVTGVGFIDLDLDGTPELLLFDPGAGSSMGVQFFDLVDGQPECISASSEGFKYAFGGAYFSPLLYVNTTSFQSFRLREAADGRLYFEAESYNGAEDFRYRELIRFFGTDGVLTLESVACMQTRLNPETGIEYTVYSVGDTPIDAGAYQSILDDAACAVDLGYEAAGVFLWEGEDYGTDLAGFTAMLEDAVAACVPAV